MFRLVIVAYLSLTIGHPGLIFSDSTKESIKYTHVDTPNNDMEMA